MNADLTLKGKAYKLQYSDKAGSVRRSTTDGATLPHVMSIKHSSAVSSATKVAINRTLVRIDMSHLLSDGVSPGPEPVSAYMVVQHATGLNAPTTAAIQTAVQSLIQALTGTVADGSALNLLDAICVNKEQ